VYHKVFKVTQKPDKKEAKGSKIVWQYYKIYTKWTTKVRQVCFICWFMFSVIF